MKALNTIGYEGAELTPFIHALIRHDIDCVLDIRERPSSRKKGFSKTPLSRALAVSGIEYRHERALGSPKALRDRLREDHDYPAYFADFKRYLSSQQPLLHALSGELSGRVALLCFERAPERCHRRAVAEALARLTGLTPHDLYVVEPGAGQKSV